MTHDDERWSQGAGSSVGDLLGSNRRRLQIFVHLAYGFDSVEWERRWRSGRLLGVNERMPYGYYRATARGCRVVYSKGHRELVFIKLVRGLFRILLGFDFVHAFRNRREIFNADVVWTHTESQHLSVLLLCMLMRTGRRPRIIAQSVWLMDNWDKLSTVKKALYRGLMGRADLLTFLSPLNAEKCRGIMPGKRVEFVRFGVNAVTKAPPKTSYSGKPVRVLAVGNDRHRDWKTCLGAFGDDREFVVKIASKTISRRRTAAYRNITVVDVMNNDELDALYLWADVFVVTLMPNLHASGVTVLQEAALFGLPVVCTRAGGMDSYFTDREVLYVAPGAPGELRSAVLTLMENCNEATRIAKNLQSRMAEDDLSSISYVAAYVELSRELVGASQPQSMAYQMS